MTINKVPEGYTPLEYSGNASNKRFAVTWPVRNSGELIVYLDGITPSIIAWAFTATQDADGNDNGGYVDFTTAPANGAVIRIERVTPIARPEYVSLGLTSFPPLISHINSEFSKHILILQELARGVAEGGDGSGGTGNSTDVFIRPENYGCVGDGVTDDSDNFNLFLQACIGSGKRGYIKSRYRLTKGMAPITGSISLDGPGTIYFDLGTTAASQSPLVINIPSLGGVIPSSIVASQDYTFPGAGFASRVAKITLPSGHSVAAGQLWKIYSDDYVAHSGVEAYMGETALIAYVDGNDAYTTSPLRNSYATNIRMARYDTSANVSFSDITLESKWANSSGGSGSLFKMVDLRGTVSARFKDLTFINVMDVGIYNSGYATVINGCRFSGGPTNSTLGLNTFGVFDIGEFMLLSNCYFDNMRRGHQSSSNVTPDSWTQFGAASGFLVSNSHARGCSGSGFGTGSSVDHGVFMGCSSASHYGSQGAVASAGFNIYGKGITVQACEAYNTIVGAQFNKAYQNDLYECKLVDFQYDGPGKPLKVINPTAYQTPQIIVDGGRWKSTATELVNLAYAWVTLSNTYMKQDTAAIDPVAITIGSTCKLEFSSVEYDALSNTDDGSRFINAAQTGCEIYGDVKVRSGGAGWAAFLVANSQSIVAHITGEANAAPNVASGLFNVPAGSATCSYRVFEGGTWKTNQRVTYDSTGTKIGIAQITDTVFSLYNVTATTNVNDAYPGWKHSQVMHVINDTTSTQSVVIKNNPSNKLAMGADVTLAAGEGCTLVWDGVSSLWRRATQSPGAGGGGGITGIALKEGSTTQVASTTTIVFGSTDFDVSTTAVVTLQTDVLRTTWTGQVDAAGNNLVAPSVKAFNLVDSGVTHSSAGTLTINYANGNMQKVTVQANITGLSITNAPSVGAQLMLYMSWTGTYTCTFGTTADWGAAGIPTTYTTGVASGTVDILQLVKPSSATKWAAMAVQGFGTAVVS